MGGRPGPAEAQGPRLPCPGVGGAVFRGRGREQRPHRGTVGQVVLCTLAGRRGRNRSSRSPVNDPGSAGHRSGTSLALGGLGPGPREPGEEAPPDGLLSVRPPCSLICVPFQAVVRAQSLVKKCLQGWKGECGLSMASLPGGARDQGAGDSSRQGPTPTSPHEPTRGGCSVAPQDSSAQGQDPLREERRGTSPMF